MAALGLARRRALREPGVIAAVLVTCAAGITLTIRHHVTPLPVPRAQAVHAALRDAATRRALSGHDWNHIEVSPVDSRLDRVSFFAGDRIVAEDAVARGGRVTEASDFKDQPVPYGDWIAYEPAVMIGLAAVFALMACVKPWWRIRNLDVAAALSLVVSVFLLQRRYVNGSVISAMPGLLYLMARCAWYALGRARPALPSTPLLAAMTPAMESSRRVRWLRLLLVVIAAVVVMIGLSSPNAVDVAYAVMEGATKLIAGLLPYGHMPGDVVHGDTYPLLSYALYVPLAWLAPVRSTWDSVDVALGAAVAAALAVAWVVFRTVAGARWRSGIARQPETEEAGLRAAILCLTFPPLVIAVSAGTNDLVLALLLALAVGLWRRPALATGVLGAASWFKLAPLALLPIALAPLRGRRLALAIGALIAVSVPLVALLVSLGGPGGPGAMIDAISFQFSRGSPQSMWAALGIGGLQPLGQALLLGFVAGAAVHVGRDPLLATDRVRIAALAAAILIGLQLVTDYWAFLYVTWVIPLLALSVLSDSVAAQTAPVSERAWPGRTPELAGAA